MNENLRSLLPPLSWERERVRCDNHGYDETTWSLPFGYGLEIELTIGRSHDPEAKGMRVTVEPLFQRDRCGQMKTLISRGITQDDIMALLELTTTELKQRLRDTEQIIEERMKKKNEEDL